MARRRRCAKCGHLNPLDAPECEKCAVLFRDVGDQPFPGVQGEKKTPHESNPNEVYCRCGCGRPASIFPNVTRGGGEGWASGCWENFDQDAPSFQINKALERVGAIREFLKQHEGPKPGRRQSPPPPEREPGQDDEELEPF